MSLADLHTAVRHNLPPPHVAALMPDELPLQPNAS